MTTRKKNRSSEPTRRNHSPSAPEIKAKRPSSTAPKAAASLSAPKAAASLASSARLRSELPNPMKLKKAEAQNNASTSASIEEAYGQLLAENARLAAQVADLNAKLSNSPIVTRLSGEQRLSGEHKLNIAIREVEGKALAPPVIVNGNIELPLSTVQHVQDSIAVMSDVLNAAVRELDLFIRREFDIFDPRIRTLHEVRTLLVNAAGHTDRAPPPLPELQATDFVDISELAEVVNSMFPGSRASRISIPIPASPRLPKDTP
jgi:hypothetical protein